MTAFAFLEGRLFVTVALQLLTKKGINQAGSGASHRQSSRHHPRHDCLLLSLRLAQQAPQAPVCAAQRASTQEEHSGDSDRKDRISSPVSTQPLKALCKPNTEGRTLIILLIQA